MFVIYCACPTPGLGRLMSFALACAVSRRLKSSLCGITLSVAVWREIAWLCVGQVAAAIGVVLTVRTLTTLLGPQSYGELSLGITLSTLASQVILGPLSNAVDRFFVFARETGEIPEFLVAAKRLTTGASLLVLLAGTAIICGLSVLGPQWILLSCAAVAFALLSGWDKLLSGLQNAARQRRAVALHQALREWLKLVLAVAAVMFARSSVSALFAYAVASMIVLASQFVVFRRLVEPVALARPRVSLASATEQRILSYALPFALYGVFTWLQLSSDRWALEWFTNTSIVGLYAAVSQLGAYPLSMLTVLVMQLVAPILFSQAGDGRDPDRVANAMRRLWLLCGAMLLLTIVGTLVSLLAHTFIFRLLIGPEFAQVSFLLPVAVLASGIFSTGQIASLGPQIVGNSKSLILPTLGTAALSVIMNIVGAILFNIEGVLGALLLFSVCYAGSVGFVNVRQYAALRANGVSR
jgi:O-antigen/teichoic acid export membrane protein